MSPEVRLIWQADCLLGEGPVWIAREQALCFVDIKQGRLHRYVPSTGACETVQVGGTPSFIVPEAGGGLVVGSEHGVWRVEDGQLGTCLAAIDQPARNRTNDATVDSQGRLWFGTMDDDERQPTGALYCLNNAGLHKVGGQAVVTNGPAITPDSKWLYHVDSANRSIWRYTIEAGPVLSRGEVFLQLIEADGYPDGVVLDSENCLWVALWDGASVRRYSPAGKLLMTVNLPCSRVTKIAFGGPDLSTAFVTTARIGLTETQLAKHPLAGGLFAFDAPVPGLPLPECRR